jgi:hypothetical protein
MKREKLKQWLEPVDPLRAHEKANEKRMDLTGLWFIRGKFQEWKKGSNGSPRVLWLGGKSGSGKTILHSAAVEEVRSLHAADPAIGLAFYYCSFGDQKSQEPASILGSVLYQLSVQKPET